MSITVVEFHCLAVLMGFLCIKVVPIWSQLIYLMSGIVGHVTPAQFWGNNATDVPQHKLEGGVPPVSDGLTPVMFPQHHRLYTVCVGGEWGRSRGARWYHWASVDVNATGGRHHQTRLHPRYRLQLSLRSGQRQLRQGTTTTTSLRLGTTTTDQVRCV